MRGCGQACSGPVRAEALLLGFIGGGGSGSSSHGSLTRPLPAGVTPMAAPGRDGLGASLSGTRPGGRRVRSQHGSAERTTPPAPSPHDTPSPSCSQTADPGKVRSAGVGGATDLGTRAAGAGRGGHRPPAPGPAAGTRGGRRTRARAGRSRHRARRPRCPRRGGGHTRHLHRTATDPTRRSLPAPPRLRGRQPQGPQVPRIRPGCARRAAAAMGGEAPLRVCPALSRPRRAPSSTNTALGATRLPPAHTPHPSPLQPITPHPSPLILHPHPSPVTPSTLTPPPSTHHPSPLPPSSRHPPPLPLHPSTLTPHPFNPSPLTLTRHLLVAPPSLAPFLTHHPSPHLPISLTSFTSAPVLPPPTSPAFPQSSGHTAPRLRVCLCARRHGGRWEPCAPTPRARPCTCPPHWASRRRRRRGAARGQPRGTDPHATT